MYDLSDKIEKAMNKNKSADVAYHNGYLLENFIDDGKNIWIIDWECGGMKDRYFDLEDFAVEHPFSGEQEELFSVAGVRADSLPAADLYIFSSPTQIGSPPGKIRRFLKKLKLPVAEAKYALISTCEDENNQVLAMLSGILDNKGLQKAAAGIKINVVGLKGLLEENYTQKLDSFVQELSKAAI